MLVNRCDAVTETLLVAAPYNDIGFVGLVHVKRRLPGHVVVVASRICGQQIVVVICNVIVGIVDRVESSSNRRWWCVAISAQAYSSRRLT